MSNRINYIEQAKRIKELQASLNAQVKHFVKLQANTSTQYGDLGHVCMELENLVKFMGGKI